MSKSRVDVSREALAQIRGVFGWFNDVFAAELMRGDWRTYAARPVVDTFQSDSDAAAALARGVVAIVERCLSEHDNTAALFKEWLPAVEDMAKTRKHVCAFSHATNTGVDPLVAFRDYAAAVVWDVLVVVVGATLDQFPPVGLN